MAIYKIAKINLVSETRIQADCDVLSAKIASNAEFCATELLASAEIAPQEINSSSQRDQLHLDPAREITLEIDHQTEHKIFENAKRIIKNIHIEAAASIEKVTEQAETGIHAIKTLVDEISGEVIKQTKIARAKLDETRLDPRTAKTVKKNATDAKVRLDAQSNYALARLKDEVRMAVNENELLVEQSAKHLNTVTIAAEQHIISARDNAILKLKDILSQQDSQ